MSMASVCHPQNSISNFDARDRGADGGDGTGDVEAEDDGERHVVPVIDAELLDGPVDGVDSDGVVFDEDLGGLGL